MTSTVIKPAVGNLQKQHDVDLVCEGAASYLLMLDSLIESEPSSRELLMIGSQSYIGSVAALESCGAASERLDTLSSKARSYGKRLLAYYLPLDQGTGELFERALNETTAAQAEQLFWGASGWLTWVARQQGAPGAMVDLIMIERIMARLLELDATVGNGGPHLFFGALLGSKPELIGGKPAQSRFHFERALELSDRTFLLVHTTYAETYCRMVFDKELHDRLLQEVLDFSLDRAADLTLTNQIAKRTARRLLAEDFFAE